MDTNHPAAVGVRRRSAGQRRTVAATVGLAGAALAGTVGLAVVAGHGSASASTPTASTPTAQNPSSGTDAEHGYGWSGGWSAPGSGLRSFGGSGGHATSGGS